MTQFPQQGRPSQRCQPLFGGGTAERGGLAFPDAEGHSVTQGGRTVSRGQCGYWLLRVTPQSGVCPGTGEEAPAALQGGLNSEKAVLPTFLLKGRQQTGGSARGLGPGQPATQGVCPAVLPGNSPRTRAAKSMPTRLHPLMSCSLSLLRFAAPSSPLFRLSNGFHLPLILFTLFLASKGLSFKRCNGVWGEEALENYAGAGF